MLSVAIILVLLGLLIWGIERNHHRGPRVPTRLAGSTGIEDRDQARVREELDLAAARQRD
jgi:hypothetical protein